VLNNLRVHFPADPQHEWPVWAADAVRGGRENAGGHCHRNRSILGPTSCAAGSAAAGSRDVGGRECGATGAAAESARTAGHVQGSVPA